MKAVGFVQQWASFGKRRKFFFGTTGRDPARRYKGRKLEPDEVVAKLKARKLSVIAEREE